MYVLLYFILLLAYYFIQACGVLIEMEGDMLLVGIGCNVLSAPLVNASTNTATASALLRPATCLADYNTEIAQAALRLAAAATSAVVAQESDVHQNGEHTVSSDGTVDATSHAESSTSSGISTVESSSTTVAAASASTTKAPGNNLLPLTLREGDYHMELALEICDNLHHWIASRTDTAEQVLTDFTANMDYSPQRLRDEPDPNLGTVIPLGLNTDGTLKVGTLYTFYFLSCNIYILLFMSVCGTFLLSPP